MPKHVGRPSPALVLSAVALTIAMAGTAVAGPDSLAKVTKKKVRTIATKQIAAAAPTLNVASAAKADEAKIASNVFSATVALNGTMRNSIPAGATSSRADLGTYAFEAPRSLAGCNVTANPATGLAASPGSVSFGFASDTELVVFTRNAAGVVSDLSFNIQAICPP